MKTKIEILIHAEFTINEKDDETLDDAKKYIDEDIDRAIHKLEKDSAWLENVDCEVAFESEGEFIWKKREEI